MCVFWYPNFHLIYQVLYPMIPSFLFRIHEHCPVLVLMVLLATSEHLTPQWWTMPLKSFEHRLTANETPDSNMGTRMNQVVESKSPHSKGFNWLRSTVVWEKASKQWEPFSKPSCGKNRLAPGRLLCDQNVDSITLCDLIQLCDFFLPRPSPNQMVGWVGHIGDELLPSYIGTI